MSDTKTIKNLLVGIFLLMLFSVIFFARDLFLPIVIGVLVALTFSPVVRSLARLGVPEALSAVLVIFGTGTVIGLGVYVLSGPVSDLMADLPQMGRDVRLKLDGFFETLHAAQDATKQVEEIANGDAATQTVALEQPGLLSMAAGTVASFLSLSAAGMVLAMFLLSSVDLFNEKLVAALPTFADKRRAVETMRDIERQISRYFLTITMINAALGLCIWLGLSAVGFQNALLWGALAFCLNFLPFIGALIGAAGVAALGLIASDTLLSGLLPAAIYLSLTTIEGQFLTPAILGRRLELNTVSVFLAVLVWGWMWSIPGALMAVPFLVMVKVTCDNVEGLKVFGNFLGASAPSAVDPAAKS